MIGSAIAAGVLLAVALFLAQEYRLSSNLRRARAHVPILQAKLAEDERFVAVKVTESPTLYGSLLIRGFVVTEEDAAALRQAIDATNPPVKLDWQLRVFGQAAVVEVLSKAKPPATQGASPPSP
jgi:hypothetical protein